MLVVWGALFFSIPARAKSIICLLSLQAIEGEIAQILSEKDVTKYYGSTTTLANLRAKIAEAPDQLRRAGLEFEPAAEGRGETNVPRLAIGWLHWQKRAEVSGAEGVDLYAEGKVLLIRSAKAASESHDSPIGPAIRHSRMPELLRQIQELDVELYVDPSMDVTHMKGYYKPAALQKGRIVIGVNTSYHALLHEIEHAKFDKHEVSGFVFAAERALALGSGEAALKALVAKEPYAGFGKEKLESILALMRAGVPGSVLAMNEAMATAAQVNALREVPRTSTADYLNVVTQLRKANNYLLRHALDALVVHTLDRRGLDLSSDQRKLFLNLMDALGVVRDKEYCDTQLPRLVAIYRERMGPPTLTSAQTKGAVVAGAASVIAVVFQKDIGQFILYLSNGSQIELGPAVSVDDDDKKSPKLGKGL